MDTEHNEQEHTDMMSASGSQEHTQNYTSGGYMKAT